MESISGNMTIYHRTNNTIGHCPLSLLRPDLDCSGWRSFYFGGTELGRSCISSDHDMGVGRVTPGESNQCVMLVLVTNFHVVNDGSFYPRFRSFFTLSEMHVRLGYEFTSESPKM